MLRGVVTPLLCERIVAEAERVGFAPSPHAAANTHLQVSVGRSRALLTIFHAVYTSLRGFLRTHYDVELITWQDPTSLAEFKSACNDAFVSRYEANSSYSGILLHRDGEDFAFVVQLNASSAFEGGGTTYPHYGKTSQLAQGDMGVHPGFVLHGGRKITSGTRLILTGFLKVEPRAPSVRLLHPLRTGDVKARAIENALEVSPEADVALAKLFSGYDAAQGAGPGAHATYFSRRKQQMSDSDSAPEPELEETIPSQDLNSRRTLYTAQTRLRDQRTGQQYDFYGLFCTEPLHRGDFIGLYSGLWTHEEQPLTEEENRYAITLSAGLVVTPALTNGASDPALFPIAMSNEPRRGRHANAMLIEWNFTRAQVAAVPDDVADDAFFGCALVACAFIAPGAEIRWDHGECYPRARYHYARGLPCLQRPTATSWVRSWGCTTSAAGCRTRRCLRCSSRRPSHPPTTNPTPNGHREGFLTTVLHVVSEGGFGWSPSYRILVPRYVAQQSPHPPDLGDGHGKRRVLWGGAELHRVEAHRGAPASARLEQSCCARVSTISHAACERCSTCRPHPGPTGCSLRDGSQVPVTRP